MNITRKYKVSKFLKRGGKNHKAKLMGCIQPTITKFLKFHLEMMAFFSVLKKIFPLNHFFQLKVLKKVTKVTSKVQLIEYCIIWHPKFIILTVIGTSLIRYSFNFLDAIVLQKCFKGKSHCSVSHLIHPLCLKYWILSSE